MKSKKTSKKSRPKKVNKKGNFQRIGQYKLAKNRKTKYIQLEVGPNAPKEVKVLLKKLIALLGTSRLFINMFDDEFREKYNIPDFVKGSISVNMDADEDESDIDDEDDDDDSDEDDDEDDDDEDDDDSDDDDEDEDELGF